MPPSTAPLLTGTKITSKHKIRADAPTAAKNLSVDARIDHINIMIYLPFFITDNILK
jgi:hypothetical protein